MRLDTRSGERNETRSAVTLVAVDCAYAPLAALALARSAAQLPVARVLLLTDAAIACDGVEVVAIAPIRSRAAYSRFMLKELVGYIATDYALVVQWDGFVIDGKRWVDEFWHHDYIGAKWPHAGGEGEGDFRVGNGGFSLRSKRLLDALTDPDITLNTDENEDEAICVRHREFLEKKYGIVFADERVADRFSAEVGRPVGPTFGFHGVFNFWQVLTDAELIDFAHTAPQAIVVGLGFGSLAKNLVDLKRVAVADAFVARRLSAVPDEPPALALRARLDALKTVVLPTTESSVKPPSSRNDPCPCASGKRYKDCHGKLGAALGGQALFSVEDVLADALRHHERGDVQYAVERYARVLQQAPENATALHFAGLSHYQAGQPSAALELMWRSVQLADQEPEFFSNMSAAAWMSGRYDEGRWAAERALALDEKHVGALNNLGFNLRSMNDIDGSIAAFDRALQLAPEFNYARWNRTFSLLARGDYARGFADYELRLQFPQTQPSGRIPANTPIWRGEVAEAKSILLMCEQGLGDTFMFARFVPQVVARGLKVTLAVQRSQVALMQQSFTDARVVAVVAVGEHESLAFDYWASLWSLPPALGITLTNLPAPTRFFDTQAADVSAWQRRLDEASIHHSGAAPKVSPLRVGIVWQGQLAGQDNQMADRSIPPRLMRRFVEAHPEICWVSLQHGAPPLAALNVIDASADVIEFTQMAALIDALDLVISIDTGAAHLAAALGAKTWVLLRHAGDWRFGITGESCAWSPTMRLFRQDDARRWEPVFVQVSAALQQWQRQGAASAAPSH